MDTNEKTYMVLDLKDYSVSYLADVPDDGWTEEYKTEKLVLRYIPAGSFVMGSPWNEVGREDNETQHIVTLTRPFYIGVFQCTQKQYKLITDDDPSYFKGETHPVDRVSYETLRGKEKGAQWPDNNSVDDDSFFGILRAKAGFEFDLPTEAQWEYACRAGTTTAWNNGLHIIDTEKDFKLDELGRYSCNGGFSDEYHEDPVGHAEVGSFWPNAWGLYDMHGNVREWCLDWYEYPNVEVTDPKGAESGEFRVFRGGGWDDRAGICRSACRGYCGPCARRYFGFRVVLVQKQEWEKALEENKSKVKIKNFGPKTYMVIDLKDYSVSYLPDVPAGGWTDEYKTEKLVLRYIPAGSFVMGSPEDELGRRGNETQHKVTLTRPFYMGVFQVTQKQYELITGDNPSRFKGETHPVEYVYYDKLRGEEKGSWWPFNDLVDEDSFFGILCAKSGLRFDLPTEAQWEYACRAGTTTAWNNGKDITDTEKDPKDPELDKLGRYRFNGGRDEHGKLIDHVVVGSYLPNGWGLYDMHGNVWEWCLDRYGEYPNAEATDPKGAETLCGDRVLRGGSWYLDADFCRSAGRFSSYPFLADGYYGFRVALVL
jgi:formylglycine-generating enzyme required for sulfatase activity